MSNVIVSGQALPIAVGSASPVYGQNNSTETIYLGSGPDLSLTNYMAMVDPGGTFNWPAGQTLYAITAGNPATINIAENGASTTSGSTRIAGAVDINTISGPVELAPGTAVAVQGNINATIQNASIPVTGNVNATIQNASIPVTGTVTADIGAGSSVQISSGTVDIQQVNGNVSTFAGAAGEVITAGSVNFGGSGITQTIVLNNYVYNLAANYTAIAVEINFPTSVPFWTSGQWGYIQAVQGNSNSKQWAEFLISPDGGCRFVVPVRNTQASITLVLNYSGYTTTYPATYSVIGLSSPITAPSYEHNYNGLSAEAYGNSARVSLSSTGIVTAPVGSKSGPFVFSAGQSNANPQGSTVYADAIYYRSGVTGDDLVRGTMSSYVFGPVTLAAPYLPIGAKMEVYSSSTAINMSYAFIWSD